MLQFLAFITFTSTHYKERTHIIQGESSTEKNHTSYFKPVQLLFLLPFPTNSVLLDDTKKTGPTGELFHSDLSHSESSSDTEKII